ncbi:hypothetical protein TSUD_24160 [Trifolium subterraneum]|uniref:Pentatricopeptide repeat-containing protein n=1 Tax=Trifolium subterraneum TaxID=3900 RepID=A0A2Z6PGY0_TRISU|nr:hypothetical protein TSUD_24160 [Trifolium subterraneum]
MGTAHRVFDEMLLRNTITWTTLMKGYLINGDLEIVFHVACDMYFLGVVFNEHTCSVVLQKCRFAEDRIHEDILMPKTGIGLCIVKQLHGLVVATWNGQRSLESFCQHLLRTVLLIEPEFFLNMLQNDVPLVCIVAGKSVHAYPIKAGLEDDTAVGNAIMTCLLNVALLGMLMGYLLVEQDIYPKMKDLDNRLLDRHRHPLPDLLKCE